MGYVQDGGHDVLLWFKADERASWLYSVFRQLPDAQGTFDLWGDGMGAKQSVRKDYPS